MISEEEEALIQEEAEIREAEAEIRRREDEEMGIQQDEALGAVLHQNLNFKVLKPRV